MLQLSAPADLVKGSLDEASEILYRETGSKPTGILVSSSYDVDYAMGICRGLLLDMVRHFPPDAWILYNYKDFVVSEGA